MSSFLSKTVLFSSLTLAVCQVNAQSLLDASYVSLKVGSSHVSTKHEVHHVDINETNEIQNGSRTNLSHSVDQSSGSVTNNKTNVSGAIAYGLDFSKISNIPVRTEIEYANSGKLNTTKTAKDDEGDVKVLQSIKSKTLFLNNYYDFKNSTKFTPYLTAGLGVAFNKVGSTYREKDEDDSSFNSKSNNFAWNVGAGVAYEIMKNTSLDLSYRFVDAGKVSKRFSEEEISLDDNEETIYRGDSSYKTRIKSHNIMIGLRYTF